MHAFLECTETLDACTPKTEVYEASPLNTDLYCPPSLHSGRADGTDVESTIEDGYVFLREMHLSFKSSIQSYIHSIILYHKYREVFAQGKCIVCVAIFQICCKFNETMWITNSDIRISRLLRNDETLKDLFRVELLVLHFFNWKIRYCSVIDSIEEILNSDYIDIELLLTEIEGSEC